ncbi:K+/H+ antiporter [Methanobrevibacter arboriphilus]|jgi:cell volume regulation protein A|uniref:K+/H+ antiporter n=1 Tax=Methanobrevibacter arboriphilus TaxID=39441 RepID=A0ACA8R545_METAZ|nr:potassium/proton antiporter [Methanobrevibacter arboriphilus]MCC7562104.1 potassium/proton antiporter [Methanobrevibacter arboriphilus]BBL62040.1 K+/H+ antiporter [Methanobrevibacter arboriphilus]GLI11159.1 K+/H+ antiporter [Methanobrevibacter arboriphilus]
MIDIQLILLAIGSLLLAGVLLSKLSSYIGVPTLIVFLLLGLFFNGNTLFTPSVDNYAYIQYISIFALIIIMFSGGLDTNTKKMKPIASRGAVLATVGVLITAIATGLLIHYLLGIDIVLSLLMGSIISSTDAAAVFSIFRSGKIKLKKNLAETLELESGANDPMAYVLTISFLELLTHPTTSIEGIIFLFLKSLILGAVFGVISGKLSVKLFENVNLDVKGLYPVLLVALAVLTFSISEIVGANGFLAVYIAGIMIGNAKMIKDAKLSNETNTTFFEGLAWLMQVIMFLVLGLFIFPNQLLETAGISIAIAIALMFISRPIAVFTSLIPFKVSLKEKVFLSWTGIKGAVPIVFATYPLVAGIPEAYTIFNVVFFITIISVILQGGTIKFVARKLDLLSTC